MKIENILRLCMLGVLIMGIILGAVGTLAYQEFRNKRMLNGLYIYRGDRESVIEYAYQRDNKGDWVCVNVAYDMKPSEAYQTCVHECSHKAYTEIFAEWCKDDLTKCLGVVENYEK